MMTPTALATALAATVAAMLIQHLGLAQAVAAVLARIASCMQCTVLWCVLAALAYRRCDPVAAVALAVLAAYASHWLSLLLIYLQRTFTYIYYGKGTEQKEEGGGGDPAEARH